MCRSSYLHVEGKSCCNSSLPVFNYLQMPPSPSLSKVSAVARPLSPELPTVHYTKNKTPPIGRVPSSDSRGTIILTQANLTGGDNYLFRISKLAALVSRVKAYISFMSGNGETAKGDSAKHKSVDVTIAFSKTLVGISLRLETAAVG